MRTKALDESNRAVARPGGFRGEADKTGRGANRTKKLASAVAKSYGGTSHTTKSGYQRHR
jgi:hypothetical protein